MATATISQTAQPHAAAPAAGVPWTVWCGALAITMSSIGGAWDVSWHRSIGRDTFWTPAHMAIYACGVLTAIACGYLILTETFSRSHQNNSGSVNVLGLRAPLGAFIASWGGIAMLASAPFDNWWHNAYGLDVRIVSPPHTVLMIGIFTIAIGILFLIGAAMNRAANSEDRSSHITLQRLFLYIGGLITSQQMFFLLELTWESKLHNVAAYVAMSIGIPFVFALLSASSGSRWAATTAASVYMLFRIGEILLLPLFPAHPKLGPVFYPVTHMVPAKFPILIIVPALALDLFWQRARNWSPWKLAVISGTLFVAFLVAAEWPFAIFLLSKASHNRFFGTIYFDYSSLPISTDRRGVFFHPSHGIQLLSGLLRAAIYSSISIWMGLRFGRWMRGVQR